MATVDSATPLTPTSSVHDIYSHVTSIKQLRQLGNAFDAILLLQHSGTPNSPSAALTHSTCYHLYQAVTAFKSRNKPRYKTLEAAFAAHRQHALYGDAVVGDEVDHAATHAAPQMRHARKVVDRVSEATPVPASVAPSSTSASDLFCRLSEAVDNLQARIASFDTELRSLHRQVLVCQGLVQASHATQHVPSDGAPLNTQSMTCHRSSSSVREERWNTSPLDHAQTGRNDIDDRGVVDDGYGDDGGVVEVQREAPATNVEQSRDTRTTQSPYTGENQLQHQGPSSTSQERDGVSAVPPQPVTLSPPDHRNKATDGHNQLTVGRNAGAVPRKRRRGSSASRDTSESSAERDGQRCRHTEAAAVQTSADAPAVWVQSKRVDVALNRADLSEVFSHFGSVRQVDVPTPRAGSLPFAFVHFTNEQDALLTLQRAARGEFEHVMVRAYRTRGQQAARAGASASVA